MPPKRMDSPPPAEAGEEDEEVEVYRNPAEHFVASFIGNPPMNFINATPEGGGKWKVAGQVYDGPSADKPKLEFAIRPEDIALAETGLKAKATVKAATAAAKNPMVREVVKKALRHALRGAPPAAAVVATGMTYYHSGQQEEDQNAGWAGASSSSITAPWS